MAIAKNKTPKLEFVISLCLLAILFIIGFFIIIRQFNFHAPAVADSKNDIENILNSLVPAGFEPLSEIAVYNAENLYEKINGKAPFYLETGFEKLFTKWLTSRADDKLMFEFYVYDMAEPQNAFSVYSAQRRPDAYILPLFDTHFGYRTENALFFVQGKYYFELVGSAKSQILFNAMSEFAQELSAGLSVEKQFQLSEPLAAAANLVPGSIKYYTANALGFEGFNDTFTASYKIDGSTVTILLSERPDEQNAKQLVESYCKFLLDTGAEEKPVNLPVDNARLLDFYGTTEIVFNNAFFVAGIHEADDAETAGKAARLLNDILNGHTKK